MTRRFRGWKPGAEPLAVREGVGTLFRPGGRRVEILISVLFFKGREIFFRIFLSSRVQIRPPTAPPPLPTPPRFLPRVCTVSPGPQTLPSEPWTLNHGVRHLALNHLPSARELALSPGQTVETSVAGPGSSSRRYVNLRPTPYTLHHVPCTLHPAPRSIHSTP